jgi:hypothetical protein
MRGLIKICKLLKFADSGSDIGHDTCKKLLQVRAQLIEFTDRYQALGIPYPDVNTVCKGRCQGTGVVPVSLEYATDSRFIELWHKAEKECPSEDDWHFVDCPDCDGTGKKLDKTAAKVFINLPVDYDPQETEVIVEYDVWNTKGIEQTQDSPAEPASTEIVINTVVKGDKNIVNELPVEVTHHLESIIRDNLQSNY